MTSVPLSFGHLEFCTKCTSMKSELTRQIDAFETLFHWNCNLKADILIQNLREVLRKFPTDNQVPSNTATRNITTLALPSTNNVQLQLGNTVLERTSRNGSSNETITTPTTTTIVQSPFITATCSSQNSDKLNLSSVNQKNKVKRFPKKRKTTLLAEDTLNSEKENNNDDNKETSEIQSPTLAKSKRKGRKRKKDQEVVKLSFSNFDDADGVEGSDGKVNNLNQESTAKRGKALPRTRKQVKPQEGIKKKRRRKRKLLFSSQRQAVSSRRHLNAKQVKPAGQQTPTNVITDNNDEDNDEDNNIHNDDDNSEEETTANNTKNEIKKMGTEVEINEPPLASQDYILTPEKMKQAFDEIRQKRIKVDGGKFRTVYECLICHKTLTAKMNAALHIRRVHYKDRIACLFCGQGFYDWRLLRNHQSTCPAKVRKQKPTPNLTCIGNTTQNDNSKDEENINVSINTNNNSERALMKKKVPIKKRIQKRRPLSRKNPIKKKKMIKKLKSTINHKYENNNDDDADSNVNVPIGQRASSPMDGGRRVTVKNTLPCFDLEKARKMTIKNAVPCFDLEKALNVRVAMERITLENCSNQDKLKTEHIEQQQQEETNPNLNRETFSPPLETNHNNNNDTDDGDPQLNSINLFSRTTREYSPDILDPPTNFKKRRRSRKSKSSRALKEMEHGTQTDFQRDLTMITPINNNDDDGTFTTPSSSNSSSIPPHNQNELSPSTINSNQITNITTTTDEQQLHYFTSPSSKSTPRNFKNTGTNTNTDEIFQPEEDEIGLLKQELTEGIQQQPQQGMHSDSPGYLTNHTNYDDDVLSNLMDSERNETFSPLTQNQEGQYTNFCDENFNLNDNNEEAYQPDEQEDDDNNDDENDQEEEQEQEVENSVQDTSVSSETVNQKKPKASAEEVNALFRDTSVGHECTMCRKVFPLGNKANIRQHIRCFHLRERDSECRFCGKIYCTQSLMLKHQRQCTQLHDDATE